MKSIAFISNHGGAGRTSLVYHLAWMYADLGLTVVAADLDPQARLSSMFLDDARLEAIWTGRSGSTVHDALEPLLAGNADVSEPHIERIADRLDLLVGDFALTADEDEFASQWPACLDGKSKAFHVSSALARVLAAAARSRDASLILVDLGPNLGALNRAALLSVDRVAIPLAPDLPSLRGLQYLGAALRRWRAEWQDRLRRHPETGHPLPAGTMEPAGYVVMRHAVRLDLPIHVQARWLDRIPAAYRESILDERVPTGMSAADDEHCLAQLGPFRSLMPLAQEARKPMFRLKPADGAIGGHTLAVADCYRDFRALARRLADETDLSLPAAGANA
jgi:chromosome partitioning protein